MKRMKRMRILLIQNRDKVDNLHVILDVSVISFNFDDESLHALE